MFKGTFQGSGAGITNITGANVTGTVPNATNAVNLTGGGTITSTNFTNSTTMLSGSDIVFQGVGPDAGDIVFVNGTGNEKARVYSDTNATNGLAFSVGAASPEVYLNQDGNLGVNTVTPTEKLEVVGNVKATSFIGSAAGLTNIPGAAITGDVPNATNLTGTGSITGTHNALTGSAVTFNTGSTLTLNSTAILGSGSGITGNQETSIFTGNGSGLRHIPASAIVGGGNLNNTNVNGNTLNGNTVIAGNVVFNSSTVIVDPALGLVVTSAIMRIRGLNDPGANNITQIPQISAGSNDGQLLIIRGLSNTAKVTFEDGDGVSLNAGVAFSMGQDDTLSLIYDSVAQEWIEISRSDR